MKVFEIIGPPGAGKTTLTNALIGHRLPHSGAVIGNSKQAVVQFRKQFMFMRRLVYRCPWLLTHARMRKMFCLSPSGRALSEAFKQKAPHWRSFLTHCLSVSSLDERDAEELMLALYWFTRALRERAYMEKLEHEYVVALVDEPLAYRLSMFSPATENMSWVKQYYDTIPLPTGILWLDGHEKTILPRLHSRHQKGQKRALRHQEMQPAEVEKDIVWAKYIACFACDIMRERGGSILRLSAEDPLAVNREKVVAFLDDL